MRRKALVAFTQEEVNSVFGSNEGNRVLTLMAKKGYIQREFLIDRKWVKDSYKGITASRFYFDSNYEAVLDLAKLWRYINGKSYFNPVKPGRILENLALCKFESKPVIFFTPWGPRYKKENPDIESGDSEIKTIEQIALVFEEFVETSFDLDFVLMPADKYGIKINNLSSERVKNYFESLEISVKSRLNELANVRILPWSEIIEMNQGAYTQLEQYYRTNFSNEVKGGIYARALDTAKFFGSGDVGDAAKRYCVERMVEADIVNQMLDPIKLSVVPKQKDVLDRELKRLYLIENTAPWMEE